MTIKKSRYKLYWLIAVLIPLFSWILPHMLIILGMILGNAIQNSGIVRIEYKLPFEHFYYGVLAFESLFIALQAFASMKILTLKRKSQLMKTIVLIVLFSVVLYSFYRYVIKYWEFVKDWIAAISV